MSASAPELKVILGTVPDAAAGERLAEALVAERLAACVQLLPGLRSVYRWRGKIERGEELLLLVKTLDAEACLERIVALHPYAVPEAMVLGPESVLPEYLTWAISERAGGGP